MNTALVTQSGCTIQLHCSCTFTLAGYFLAVSGGNLVCVDVYSLTVKQATDI